MNEQLPEQTPVPPVDPNRPATLGEVTQVAKITEAHMLAAAEEKFRKMFAVKEHDHIKYARIVDLENHISSFIGDKLSAAHEETLELISHAKDEVKKDIPELGANDKFYIGIAGIVLVGIALVFVLWGLTKYNVALGFTVMGLLAGIIGVIVLVAATKD